MPLEPSPPASPAMLIVLAGRRVQVRIEEGLAALGLTLRHVGALGHLLHGPELSYSDLARRAGVTAQSMHATVRALEERGAVARAPTAHGHAARLEITDEGRELLAAARDVVARLDAQLFGDLPPARRDALTATLLAVVGAD